MSTESIKPAHTKTGLRADGTFERTALIIGREGVYDDGSIDVVHETAGFLARINIFTNEKGDWLAVDVIDVDDQFFNRKALVFAGGQRQFLSTGTSKTVAANFDNRGKDAS